jgi:hypothetical protein
MTRNGRRAPWRQVPQPVRCEILLGSVGYSCIYLGLHETGQRSILIYYVERAAIFLFSFPLRADRVRFRKSAGR